MTPSPHSPEPLEERNRLPILFGMTSLFSDMTYELAHVLLPGLMLHFGGSAFQTALMESLAEGTKMGGFWSSGIHGSDPDKQARLVTGGYALTALATISMGFAGTAGMLVALKSLSWFGKGLRGPSRDALLSNALAATDLPKAFGTVRALDQVGGLLGPLMALALSGLLTPGEILVLSAFPGFLCVLFATRATRAAIRLRRSDDTRSSGPPPSGGTLLSVLRESLRQPSLRRYLFGGALLRAGLLPATLLMFRYASAGGSFSVTVAGFLLSSLLTVLTNLAVSRQWIPGTPRLLVGLSAPLLMLSALLLSQDIPTESHYLCAMTFWGIGEAAASVGLKVQGARLWPPDLRGKGFALFDMTSAGLSLLLWPIVALAWDRGESLAGMLTAALAAATGALLLLGPRTFPRPPA